MTKLLGTLNVILGHCLQIELLNDISIIFRVFLHENVYYRHGHLPSHLVCDGRDNYVPKCVIKFNLT